MKKFSDIFLAVLIFIPIIFWGLFIIFNIVDGAILDAEAEKCMDVICATGEPKIEEWLSQNRNSAQLISAHTDYEINMSIIWNYRMMAGIRFKRNLVIRIPYQEVNMNRYLITTNNEEITGK